jgi:hypothetical protein
MSFFSGSSTDYQDLLADLRTNALANNWQEGTGIDEGRYVNSTEDEWIVTGTGLGGSDAITVGIRTFSDVGEDYFNWELAGMDQYTDANPWSTQPNISPGRHDGAGDAVYGSYVPLCEREMNYWWSVTGRRMTGVVMVGNIFVSFYLGWANPHDTAGNYASPKVIAGTMYDPTLKYNSGNIRISGILNPIGSATGTREGPVHLLDKAGSWQTVKNRNSNNAQTVESSRDSVSELVIYPMGRIDYSPEITGADSWVQNAGAATGHTMHLEAAIPIQTTVADYPGTRRAIIRRTPDPGANEDTVYRETAIIHNLATSFVDLDGVFWCSAAAGPNDPELQPGDRVQDPDTLAWYRVFPMGSVDEDWNYLALEEK